MKIKFILNPWILFLSLVCLINASRAQSVGNGRVEARFSIDGDLMADTAFFGNVSVSSSKGKPSDDWFKNKYSGSGIGVIDTSGSWKYKNLLISSATARDTLVFTMPMSVPKLTRSGGFIMLDALYARDYFDQDQTVITSGSKTVDDPSSWNIGSGTVQSKDELMEFYSHVRRKGATVWDSLFFYFGVGVHGITGNKNVAAELFVNDVR
ncbi:MAG: hypothetical protein KG003_14160, partial [Bacteroidetes bacterium]|nr:hypothetical protein [Bacteroidota bacterium]